MNNDVVGVQFLLTLVHEIAHATSWMKFGIRVKAHGQEWKDEYRSLMFPLLCGYMSPDIEDTLRRHMVNPPASAIHTVEMNNVLFPSKKIVEHIPFGENFKIKSRNIILKKIKKNRTRWLCSDTCGNMYYVSGITEVF